MNVFKKDPLLIVAWAGITIWVGCAVFFIIMAIGQ